MLVVIDTRPGARSFQQFFDANAEQVREGMAPVLTSDPDIEIYQNIETADRVG